MNSKQWMILGLAAVNVVLGGALLLRSGAGLEKNAYGQLGGRTNTVVVPGSFNGRGVIFALDPNHGDLGAYQLDPTKQRQELIGGINITKDLEKVK